MSKHLPSTVWCTRMPSNEQFQSVQTADEHNLRIGFYPAGGGNTGYSIDLPRRDAMLLARRINQCLNNTK